MEWGDNQKHEQLQEYCVKKELWKEFETSLLYLASGFNCLQ